MRLCLTEPVGIEAGDGTRAPWSAGGRRARLVLALLVLERRRAVPRTELAEALWGADLPRSWEPSLREVVSKLRQSLAAAPAPIGTLSYEAGCYRLHAAPGLRVDVEEALAALQAAEAALPQDPPAAGAHAGAVVEIAERAFLPGEAGDWARERQAELRDVHLRGLEALAAARLSLGDPAAAAAAAHVAAGLEPLRETAHVLRMAAAAAAGDRARAIELHDEFRRRILDELGVPPSPETQAAYQQIIDDAPAAAAVTATTAVQASEPPRAMASPPAPAPAERAVRTILFSDLVGSSEVLARMGDRRWREVLDRHASLVHETADRHGLRVVSLIGDGALLVCERPSDALAAATELCRRAPEELGVALRAGVHTGECEVSGPDVAGIAVHVGARVCALAGAGELLVTSTVRDLVAGGDVRFEERGTHALRGIPGTWRLHAPVGRRAEPEPERPAPGATAAPAPRERPAPPLPGRLTIAAPTAFVGRADAVEALTVGWGDVRQGQRRIALLAGEPGIGKTRLSTEVARAAHRDGAFVLYGACQEEAGAAYGAFAQALAHLVEHAPPELLAAHAQRHGGVLMTLLPGLAERLPELSPPAPGDPETERFQLLAAISDLVVQGARTAPLILVLDDLHWADVATQAALRHLVLTADPAPYLLVGAYRHTEEANEGLTELLGTLARQEDHVRLRLDGLDRDDIAALVQPDADRHPGPGVERLVERLYSDTGGNPFFVGELLRDLVESGAVRRSADGGYVLVAELSAIASPAGVREVVARRVEQLGEQAARALGFAAVVGREFDLAVLAGVTGEDEDDLIDVLDAAVAAGIVVEIPDVPDRFRFAHALGEQALYERLSRTRRIRVHRKVAEVLQEVTGDAADARAAEVAHHLLAARPLTDAAVVRDWAMRAGRHALASHAPQEGVRWFSRSHELLDDAAPGPERLDVMIALGDAQQRAGDPGHRRTLLDATALALREGDVDRMAAAVLANARGRFSKVGEVDDERVTALEETLVRLPDDDPRRAQVLAVLAAERVWDGDVQARIELTDEALELARAAGDPVALAHVLALRQTAIWAPDTLATRLADAAELEELAGRLGDPTLRFWAAVWHGIVLAQANDAAGVERCMGEQRELAAICHQPAFDMTRLVQESWWALVRGDLEEAERLADSALAVGLEQAGDADAPINHATQLVAIRLQQGRVGELREPLEGAAQAFPGIGLLRALLCCARAADGDVAGARKLLDAEAPALAAPPIEPTTLAALAVWAEAAATLGAAEHAEALLQWLDPCRDQHVVQATATYGSAGRHAARLHALAGRLDEADRRFGDAVADLDRLGARGFAARARAEHAELLVRRGAPGDAERAAGLARAAAQEAAARGYEPVAELAGGVLARIATAGAPA